MAARTTRGMVPWKASSSTGTSAMSGMAKSDTPIPRTNVSATLNRAANEPNTMATTLPDTNPMAAHFNDTERCGG